MLEQEQKQVFTKLAVFILATNEVQSLRDTVQTVLEVCDHADLERFLIIMGDQATEDCLATAQALQTEATDAPVDICKQNGRGIAQTIAAQYDLLQGSHNVILCADGETDPHALPAFLTLAKKNPHAMIIGSRWLQGGGFERYGVWNKQLNYIFQKLFRLLYRNRLTDVTFGYMLFPNAAVKTMQLQEKGFSASIEYKVYFIKRNIPIIETPVVWKAREEGKSDNSFFKKLRYVRVMLRYVFSNPK